MKQDNKNAAPTETKKCPLCKEEINKDAMKCKHCNTDLKKHKNISTAKGCLIVFLVIAFLLIISSCYSAFNSTSSSSNAGQELTGDAIENSRVSEAEEQVPSKPKEWQDVIELTATADKQSETFHLEGGRQKLTYQTSGGEMVLCSIYVLDEGTSLEEDGGFPEAMIDGSQSDETMMRKRAGDYYLDVNVVNGNCSLQIQEMR